MTGVAVLREVLSEGGQVVWASPGPRLLVPPTLRSKVEADRPALREILRRAAILRAQAVQFIPQGIPMPLLALPDNKSVDGCLSCGAEVSEGHYRCEVCAMAITLALQGLRYPWSWKGEPPLENPIHRAVQIQYTEWAGNGAGNGARNGQEIAQDTAQGKPIGH